MAVTVADELATELSRTPEGCCQLGANLRDEKSLHFPFFV
jgi:hypothetical protein